MMSATNHRQLERQSTVRARRGWSARAAIALAAIALAGAIAAPSVQASLGGCGGDPVVVLSNGATVDLFATIGDSSSDVQQILYTLHAPVGTSVVSVTYTSGVIGPKEVLLFYADSQQDTYATETVVTTGLQGIQVTATTTVVPLLDAPATASKQGYDRQPLNVSVTV